MAKETKPRTPRQIKEQASAVEEVKLHPLDPETKEDYLTVALSVFGLTRDQVFAFMEHPDNFTLVTTGGKKFQLPRDLKSFDIGKP